MINPTSSQKSIWRLSISERRTILLIGDLLANIIALLIALYFWAQQDAWLNFSWEFLSTRPPFWFFLLPLFTATLMTELYDIKKAGILVENVKGIALAGLVSALIYLVIYFSSDPTSLPRIGIAVYLIASVIFLLIWRAIYVRIFQAPRFMRRVLVVGAGTSGSILVSKFLEVWPPPFYLVGLIDDDPEKKNTLVEKYPVIGNSQAIKGIIESEQITDLVIAISGPMNGELVKVLLNASENNIRILSMEVVYEELTGRVPIFLLPSDWVLRTFAEQADVSGGYLIFKRLMDIFGGLVGCLGLALLTPFISLAILIESGRPVFFSQNRLGMNGKPYKIVKFRTMRQDAEKDGVARTATRNDDRTTRIGRLLRKTHLDEIPQFWSVLKGSVSLVGPRAERPELVADYQNSIPFYRARLFVKPGLTGWAQINQRYAENTEETAVKLEYDLYYIKKRNILLDVFILLRTVSTVIQLRGQ
ncbi:MAG TPA: sugar transferase [Longilinea sp.]|nr:sugar transferase [Longilinea sp.]